MPTPRQISIGLRILRGSFESGFRAELGTWRGTAFTFHRRDLNLPPSVEVLNAYQEWKTAYRDLSRTCSPTSAPDQIVSSSEERNAVNRCTHLGQSLRTHLEAWFRDANFQLIATEIRGINRPQNVADHESIPIFLEILDVRDQDERALYALPWHLWELFESSQFEAVIFPQDNYRIRDRIARLQFPDVLTIFGSNRGGLQLERDRQTWQQVKRHCGKIESIPTPIDAEPRNDDPVVTSVMVVRSLQGSKCRILFFAGHSASDPTFSNGELELNETETISLGNLRQSLSRAVQAPNGLILAIFNSCDGIGIARFLAARKVPYIIVMRERISDDAARQFLVHFLEEFSRGCPVYLAVKRAREQLESMPLFASWLPVTFQHPASPDLVWSNSWWAKILNVSRQSRQWLRERVRNNRRWVYAALAICSALAVVTITTAWLSQGGRPILVPGTFLQNPIEAIRQRVWPARSITVGEIALDGDEEISANRAFRTALTNRAKFNEEIDNAINGFAANSGEPDKNNPLLSIYFNNAVVEKAVRTNPTTQKLVLAVSADKNDPDATLRGVALAQAAFNCNIDQIGRQGEKPKNWKDLKCDTGKRGYLLEVAVSKYTSKNVEQIAEAISGYIAPDGQKIFGMVGRYPSGTIEQAAEALQRKVVLLAPTSNAVRVVQKSSNQPDTVFLDPKYVFRMVPDVTFIAKQLENHIETKSSQTPRIGIFYASPVAGSAQKATFSVSLKNSMETPINPIEVGGTPGNPLNCNLLSKDMQVEACLKEINDQRVSILLLIPELNQRPDSNQLNQVLAVIEAIRKLGNKPGRLIGADTMYDLEILTKIQALNGLDGLEIEVMTPWARSSATSIENRSYIERLGVYVLGTSSFNWRTATAYDSTLTLLQGIIGVFENQKELSATTLSAELSNPAFRLMQLDGIDPATGIIEFDSNGDRKPRRDLQRFVKVVCQSSGTCNFEEMLD